MPFWLWARMGRRNCVGWGPEMPRDVATGTNFGTQFAITGFVGYNFRFITARRNARIASCGNSV